MITWPDDLIKDIARRRCVLFLGSGISKNASTVGGARPKTWLEFLESAMISVQPRRHIEQMLKRGDYLTACEILKKKLGKDNYDNLITAEFLTPQFKPAAIHDNLVKLDSRIVATPNFDKIYDSHVNHLLNGSVKVKKYYDADIGNAIRRTDRVVLKIHGCVDEIGKMIFTREDYAAARNLYPNFYSILDALAITHTFIFLGCGVNDPDIRLILEDYTYRFKQSRSHFIVLPRGSIHKDEIGVVEQTMNLKVLVYDPKNHHQVLADSVVELTKLVDAVRADIASKLDW